AARGASSGSAPASPAERRARGRRSAARTARRAGRLERPLAVLLDEFPVELDPAAAPQVLDHVPVHGAHVRAADEREAVPDSEVDGAVDLLVEERVLHVLLDARVAA